ncbi:MAG: VWA domain-containing protein [Deltaproteobacteria bacterium]|nr:VWA domain-containing protein [Deltaproteobacteria bacterium]
MSGKRIWKAIQGKREISDDRSGLFMTHDREGLVKKTIEFAAFLRDRGFRVFQSSIHDVLKAIEVIGIEERSDFFFCLRSNFASTDLEWVQFKGLFDEFWTAVDVELQSVVDSRKRPDPNAPTKGEGEESNPVAEQTSLNDATPSGDRNWLEGVAYSPVVSAVETKDLGHFNQADVQVASLALKKMMAPFQVDKSRRLRRSRKTGGMDFQRSIRKSLKTGGIPFELFFKRKKLRLKRLVILADVSGSMDRYVQFVMPFLLGLRGVGSRAEVFVFSTSLTSITFSVRHMSFEKVISHIAQEVPDWSGGTRIGFSLHQFNENHGQRLLNQRTVVVVLSDGWDLGAKDLLKREMEQISRKCHKVIWLNPLAGDPDYEPLCRGMNTALPYVDHFMAADSLSSLKRVGRLLSRVMVH